MTPQSMLKRHESIPKAATRIRQKQRCGAHARSTGQPCKAKALRNGRCRNHGGLSTGPKTEAGRKAIALATRHRMASGQRERALAGFHAWLEGGGRKTLSEAAKAREQRNRWLRLTEHVAASKQAVILPIPPVSE